MTSRLQQFFADTGTLAEVRHCDRLDNSDLFFNPVAGGFDICVDTRIRFEYREDNGVTCLCLPGTTQAELELWHKGSVMGLAAWSRGLVALHVSAVEANNCLIAIAGDSGAGKSTLAAALGAHGYPLFADDTLILDRQDGAFVAMPGHKKLKLWDNAFELTGALRAEQLQPGIEKYFAQNTSISSAALLPLSDLVLLTETNAAKPLFRQVRGAEKIKRCADALYRPDLYAQIAKGQDHAALMLELSSKVRIWEFARSRNRQLFDETTRFLARNLAGLTDNSIP